MSKRKRSVRKANPVLIAKQLLAEPYHRVLVPDVNSGFSASIIEFPGCFACGETAASAYKALDQAAESWLLACMAQGMAIPLPANPDEFKVAFVPRTSRKRAA